MKTLKFGILSTASVNGYGFIPFKDRVEGMELLAVASRDEVRARDYAEEHDIPLSFGSYEELLDNSDIDCVYIPLPASMHEEWSIRALKAGKHVLCEKPVTVNAAEAERIRDVVSETSLVFAEAFHNRYHPVIEKALELVNGGEIGELLSIDASFHFIVPDFSKVQYKPEMGGGALLDLGCYPVSFARWAAGGGEAEVIKARVVNSPVNGVNLATFAKLRFENGVTARVGCGFLTIAPETALLRGSKGMVLLIQYIHPVHELAGRRIGAYILTVANKKGMRNIRVESGVTYHHQLEAFCAAVREGARPVTGPDEAVANMKLLDAINEKAAGGA